MSVAKHNRRVFLRNRHGMQGISLIEVLIAVLLSAIGLLALAGANVASVRYSKMSQYRGTATMLAADLAERMRANPTGILGYAYSSTTFAAQVSSPPAWSIACEGYGSNCANAVTQMAVSDLANWRTIVRSQLPEGSVSVAVAAVAAPTGADVWVAWRDPAVASPTDNTTESRNDAKECPPNFSTDQAVRCMYFRINL